jgi:hypothetical protein
MLIALMVMQVRLEACQHKYARFYAANQLQGGTESRTYISY